MINLDKIIHKTYVINLDHRKDRWEQVQNDFANTGLKLTKFSATNGKALTEEQIKKLTSTYCYYFCSYGMIGCWNSHFRLWQNIIKNNETNVLVLEDDAYPVSDFNNKLIEIWKEIPEDWDMIYIGCDKWFDRKIDPFLNLIIKNPKFDNIIVPSLPFTTHAYMLSNKGARKLLNFESLQKGNIHIDMVLAFSFLCNNLKKKDFKVYAMKNSLIYQHANANGSDLSENNHPIVSFILSNLKITDAYPTSTIANSQLINYRKKGIVITFFSVFMFIFSFLIGLLLPKNLIKYYSCFLIILFTMEYIIMKNKNFLNLFTELLLILGFLYIGVFIRSKLLNIFNNQNIF